jgi:hypothetical protein
MIIILNDDEAIGTMGNKVINVSAYELDITGTVDDGWRLSISGHMKTTQSSFNDFSEYFDFVKAKEAEHEESEKARRSAIQDSFEEKHVVKKTWLERLLRL